MSKIERISELKVIHDAFKAQGLPMPFLYQYEMRYIIRCIAEDAMVKP